MPQLDLALVTGGHSSERDISLKSAALARQHLDAGKYAVRVVDTADRAALTALAAAPPDVALIVLHGRGDEDGAVQGFLETLGIPYTGSGVLASALAMDKRRCKEFYAGQGVPTPEYRAFRRGDTVVDPGRRPLIVKPNASGSSDGLTVLREGSDADAFDAAVRAALALDDTVLVERFIQGMEITGGVLGNAAGDDAGALERLPLIEIVPAKGVYDREAKYTPGATDEICPARLPADLTAAAQSLAERCHLLLGCRGMSRTDMMVSERGELFVIETNTIPGMTQTSLLPRAALQAGYSFSALLDRLVALALPARDASQPAPAGKASYRAAQLIPA